MQVLEDGVAKLAVASADLRESLVGPADEELAIRALGQAGDPRLALTFSGFAEPLPHLLLRPRPRVLECAVLILDVFALLVGHLRPLQQLQGLQRLDGVLRVLGGGADRPYRHHHGVVAGQGVRQNSREQAVAEGRPLAVCRAHGAEALLEREDRAVDVSCVLAVLRSMMRRVLVALAAGTVNEGQSNVVLGAAYAEHGVRPGADGVRLSRASCAPLLRLGHELEELRGRLRGAPSQAVDLGRHSAPLVFELPWQHVSVSVNHGLELLLWILWVL
mmetsp:Transcript_51324/g.149039  ORF Transcript_51324/g.149039 Transcript_51324/m.149039 type:complete len:275 (+) Transcript_51324:425-1249(+)